MELSFVNIFGIFGVLIVSSIMFAAYGSKGYGPKGEVNLAIVLLALIFGLMGLAGLVVVELGAGSFMKNSTTTAEASFSVWFGMLFFTLPTFVGNIRLNAFAQPTESYALSALSGQKPPVEAIVNGVWAPAAENQALLGFGGVLVLLVYQKTENIYLSVFGGMSPFGLIFAIMHGVVTPSFFVFAAVVMFVMGVYLFGTDLGAWLPFSEYLPISYGLFYGVHRGINISSSGGLINWYSTILQAPEPLIYVSYLVIIMDGIMALFALVQAAEYVRKAVRIVF